MSPGLVDLSSLSVYLLLNMVSYLFSDATSDVTSGAVVINSSGVSTFTDYYLSGHLAYYL